WTTLLRRSTPRPTPSSGRRSVRRSRTQPSSLSHSVSRRCRTPTTSSCCTTAISAAMARTRNCCATTRSIRKSLHRRTREVSRMTDHKNQGAAIPTPQGAAGRLFRMIVQGNALRLVFVLIAIVISAAASVGASVFLESLIDDYIKPLLLMENPVFDKLLHALMGMACLYAAGLIATYLYNRIMVTVSQRTLKSIRDKMFSHMQSLPIRYFDTHAHGDIMSVYTNDVDTLRQMISQSIPQA